MRELLGEAARVDDEEAAEYSNNQLDDDDEQDGRGDEGEEEEGTKRAEEAARRTFGIVDELAQVRGVRPFFSFFPSLFFSSLLFVSSSVSTRSESSVDVSATTYTGALPTDTTSLVLLLHPVTLSTLR